FSVLLTDPPTARPSSPPRHLPYRLRQVRESLARALARHDELIRVGRQRFTERPFAPGPRPSGKLVAFRDRGKDAGPLRGEQVLNGAVVGARVAPDVEQPEGPREARAVEGWRDEPPEGGALA